MSSEKIQSDSVGGDSVVTVDPYALGFSLNFLSGRGLLAVRDKEIGPLSVRLLELEIPEISFPFDVTGGAERFKSRRCSLRHLVYGLSNETVNDALRRAPLRDHGFLDLKAAIRDGFVEFVGRFAIGDHQADFTFRAALLLRSQSEVNIVFYDTRVYGWLPVPSALLPVYLKRALELPLGVDSRAGIWALEPARQFLAALLPRSGWKIPDAKEAGLIAAECSRGRLTFVSGPEGDLTSRQAYERTPPVSAVKAAEGMAQMVAAEEALGAGDMQRAYELFREAEDDERGGSFVRDRLFQLGAADPEFAVETRHLAEEVLATDPKQIQPLLALAAIALREQSFGAAAERYGVLGDIARARKDRYNSIAAELASAEAAAPVDPGGALAAYERAASRARDSVAAHRALFGLRASAGDWDGAVQAGERLVKLEKSRERRSLVHRELGAMCRRHTGDLKKARMHYERSLRISPEDSQALEGLAETYAARGEPARAASYLARLAEKAESSGDEKRIVELNLRLGQIWERWLGDAESAAARYYRVLDVDPNSRPAQLCLAELAEQRGDFEEARNLYENILAVEEELGDPSALSELVATYTRLARVTLSEEGPTAEALACLERAVELDPTNPMARDELIRLLRQRGEWGRLVGLLERSVEHNISSSEIRRSLIQAARIEIEQRSNADAARYHLEHVLNDSPADDEAVTMLMPLLEEAQDYLTISERLTTAARETTQPTRRGDYLLGVARARQKMGVDASSRIAVLEAALEANPFIYAAAADLVSIYRDKGQSDELATSLERLIVAASNADERVAALLERAGLLEKDHPQKAEADLRAALRVAPENVQAWRDLSSLIARRGDPAGAREVLSRCLADDQLPADTRSQMHLHVSQLSREEGNAEQEADHLQRAIALGNDSDDVATRFIAVLTELDRIAEVADLLESWADAKEGDGAQRWLLRAASIRRDLNEFVQASNLLERVIAADGPVAAKAAVELESLCRGQGDDAGMIRSIELQVKLVEPIARPALMTRLIDTHVAAGDSDAAMKVCEALIEIDSGAMRARTMLAQAAEAQSDYDAALHHLTAMLSRPAADGEATQERRSAFVQAVAIAHELRPPVVGLLQERFKADFPAEPEETLARSLGDILTGRNDWERLLELRRQQLSAAEAEGGDVTLRLRQIAGVLSERLQRDAEAVEIYRRLLDSDRNDLVTMRALGDAYARLDDAPSQAQVFATLAQRTEDPEEAISSGLSAVQLLASAHAADAPEFVEARAQVLKEVCGRSDIDPDGEALLEALRSADMFAELVALRTSSLEHTLGVDDGRFEDLVDLCLTRLGDASRAQLWCERMVEAFGDNDRPWQIYVDALREHGEIFAMEAQATDVGTVMRRWAEQRDDQRRSELLLDLAQYLQEQGDTDGRIEALREASEADAESVDVLGRLITALEAAQEWAEALVATRRLVELQTDPDARDGVLRRCVMVADEADDDAAARSALEALQSRDGEETGRLAMMYIEQDDFEQLSELPDAVEALNAEALLRGAEGLAEAEHYRPAREYFGRVLQLAADDGEFANLWQNIAKLWVSRDRGVELALWRVEQSQELDARMAEWSRLVAYVELVALGEGADASDYGIDLENDFLAIDLGDCRQTLALFNAARGAGMRAWTERSARALEAQLSGDSVELGDVLDVRIEYELEAGDNDKAVTLAQRLVEIDSERGHAWLDLALEASGRVDDLVAHLVQQIESGVDNKGALWMRVAGLEVRRENWSAAMAALQSLDVGERDGRWGETAYQCAVQLDDSAAQVEGAKICAEHAADDSARARWLREAASNLWWHLGDAQGAQELLATAHAVAPIDVDAVLLQAEEHSAQGEAALAQRVLDESLVVVKGIEAAPLWLDLAQVRLSAEDTIGAGAAIDAGSVNMPEDERLWAKLASLATALERPEQAAQFYATAYRIEPDAHEGAYLGALEQANEWGRLVAVLTERAEEGGDEAGGRYARAGRAARDMLQDKEQAVDLLGRASRVIPSEELLDETFELAMELERLPMIAALGPALLRHMQKDAGKRSGVLRVLVDALDHLQLEADSMPYREELVRLEAASPQDRLVLARASQDTDPTAAAQMFEAAALAMTDDERGPHLLTAAEAWREVGDEDRARPLLLEAMDSGVDTVQAHDLVIRLLEGPMRMQSIARFIELGGDADMRPSRRAAIHMELGMARLEQGDGETALALVRDSAAFEKSSHWAPAMEHVLSALDRQDELATLWLSEAEAESSAWDKGALFERAHQAVQHYEAVEDVAGRVRGLDVLARLQPENDALRTRLAEAAAELGDAEKFFEQVTEQLERAADDQQRADIALRYSSVLQTQFEDTERAMGLLVEAFERTPTHRLAEALIPLVAATQTEEEHALRLVHGAEQLDDESSERLPLWFMAAGLSELSAPERAVELYERVLQIESANERAYTVCLRSYEADERWDKLVPLLRMRARVEGEDALALLMRAADLVKEHLDDEVLERELLTACLDLNVENLELRNRLVRCHVDAGELPHAKEILLASPGTQAGQVELVEKLVEAFSAAGQEQDRTEVLEWIVAMHPRSLVASAHRLHSAREGGDQESLLDELRQRLDHPGVFDADEQAHLNEEAGQVSMNLGDMNGALKHFSSALGSADMAPESIFHTVRLAEESQDDCLEAALERAVGKREEIAVAADEAPDEAQAEWQAFLGRVYTKAGEGEQAIRAHSNAVERAQTVPPKGSVDALRTHFEETERWEDLLKLQEKLLTIAATDAERSDSLYEIGLLQRDRLGEQDRAAESFVRCLSVDESRVSAKLALGLLRSAAGLHAEAQPLLLEVVDVASEELPHSNLLAFVETMRAMDEKEALVDGLGALLQREPDRPALRVERAELLESLERPADAEREWATYVDSLGPDARSEDVAPIRARLGRAARQRGDMDEAIKQLKIAHNMVSQDVEIMTELRQAYEAAERWRDGAELRVLEAVAAPNAEEQVRRYHELSGIYAERLKDPGGAALMLERALQAAPDSVETLQRLLAMHEASEDWRRFLVVGERMLAVVSEPELDSGFFARLARAYQEVAGDPGRAKEFYGKAADRDPQNDHLGDKYREMSKATGDFASWAESEMGVLPSVELGPEKLERYMELADVCLKQLGDPELALRALHGALEVDPENLKLLRQLADTYALEANTYPQAAELYGRLLAVAPLEVDVIRIRARLAGQMNDTDRAYGFYAALLALNPADDEAREYVQVCRAARPPAPQRPVQDSDRATGLLHPKQPGALEELFAPLARFAELTQPGNLATCGVHPEHELPKEDDRVVWLNRILEKLGGERFALYEWTAGGFACRVEHVTPPSLLLGTPLAENATNRERAFMVLRMAELYRTGHSLCERLGDAELGGLIAALCLAVEPQADVRSSTSETPGWTAAVSAPMTDDIRAQLAPQVLMYMQAAEEIDIGEWRQACLSSASQVALVLACDIAEALQAMLRNRGFEDIPDDQRAAVLAESGEELQLFRFSMGETYFKLRESLGLALRRQG